MKKKDKVNLITALGETHIGTVYKVGSNDIHTFTITRPGGETQKYHNVSKLPESEKKRKPRTAYWTDIKQKTKSNFDGTKPHNTKIDE